MPGHQLRTGIEEVEPVDNGVETKLRAREEFAREGELIIRETDVSLLDSGGISFYQRVQGDRELVTLGSEVVERLVEEAEERGD
ncbi:hypothetical protein [Halomarina oriensis]|uniref:Uncharacterized protein n=1 Tax=Halomarina oriensis TaxID=671145 RepID=A0A6B0GNG6_9EURY|nr:hypothetical protein [Halomarina oriensis]MWG33128.1 hypothetical protein [Halomarina oriensis]